MTAPLELLAARGADLLARVVAVACSDRELPGLADDLAGLVVRSARALTFCDVYVLDEDERALEWSGPPVPLGEGDVGWVAAHGRARTHRDGRGAALPVHSRDRVIAVVDVRSAGPCPSDDLALATALAGLFAPVLCSCRRLRTARERERAAERFAERAVEAQEAEWSRLGREIHDGIAQRLAGLGFHLSAAERALPEHHPEPLAQIMMARRLCDLAAAETRAAIGGLRPPVLDDLGLPAALATLAREAGGGPGTAAAGAGPSGAIDVTVTVEGELEDPLPGHVQTALYRIAQEAVGNSLRHASASRVDLLLEHSRDGVRLRVADDGAGFSIRDATAHGEPGRPALAGGSGGSPPTENRPGSYGLRGMRERAELLGGRVAVTSRPGAGTTVEAVIPLPRPGPGT